MRFVRGCVGLCTLDRLLRKMADGDGGEPGNGWSTWRPELYRGLPLNPTPLATALPATYPVFNVMGGSSLPVPLPSEKQGGGSSESAVPRHPHPGFWHPVPPIGGTSPSFQFPVSIPPVYFMHPPPMPPMGFPSSMRMEPPRTSGVDGLRSPAMAGVMAVPTFRGHHPHPRSNFPSGLLLFFTMGASVTRFRDL